MAAKDLDGNGIPELLLTGVSNGYNAATLVVLDPLKMSGASKEELPKFQILDQGDPVERARLLFPAPANLARQKYNEGHGVLFAPDHIIVMVHEPPPTSAGLPTTAYRSIWNCAPRTPTPPKLLSVSSPPAYAQLLDPRTNSQNFVKSVRTAWHSANRQAP